MIQCNYCGNGAKDFRAVNYNSVNDVVLVCETCYCKYFLDNMNPENNTVTAKEKVCECGKEKHGFAKHIYWCEKYEK